MAAEKVVVKVDPFLKDLIPGFLENRRNELPEMAKLLDAGDAETVRRLGHNLKGCGASYGFDRISEIGAEIENLALAGKLDEVRPLHAQLTDYLASIDVQYE